PWVAACGRVSLRLEVVQRHDLVALAVLAHFKGNKYPPEDGLHVVVHCLDFVRGIADTPRARHIEEVAPRQPTRKNVEDEAAPHLQHVAIFAHAVWERRVTALSKDAAFGVVQAERHLTLPDEALDRADGQGFALRIDDPAARSIALSMVLADEVARLAHHLAGQPGRLLKCRNLAFVLCLVQPGEKLRRLAVKYKLDFGH